MNFGSNKSQFKILRKNKRNYDAKKELRAYAREEVFKRVKRELDRHNINFAEVDFHDPKMRSLIRPMGDEPVVEPVMQSDDPNEMIQFLEEYFVSIDNDENRKYGQIKFCMERTLKSPALAHDPVESRPSDDKYGIMFVVQEEGNKSVFGFMLGKFYK